MSCQINEKMCFAVAVIHCGSWVSSVVGSCCCCGLNVSVFTV